MPIKILAISGSLRAASSNTNLLLAAQLVAPEGVTVSLYDGLALLPHFNPDIEMTAIPEAALELRRLVGASDGILISSPEYAHGVPGSLKNALDWLVGGFEFIDKPIALLNPSPQSLFAHPQLLETVTVMSGRVIKESCISLPMSGLKLGPAGIAAHPIVGPMLTIAIATFAHALQHPLA